MNDMNLSRLEKKLYITARGLFLENNARHKNTVDTVRVHVYMYSWQCIRYHITQLIWFGYIIIIIFFFLAFFTHNNRHK